jgi:YHS domain-containing protein
MTTTFKDPICGMEVIPQRAAGKSEYQGQTYFFCSLGCKDTFDSDPEKFAVMKQAHARSECCC